MQFERRAVAIEKERLERSNKINLEDYFKEDEIEESFIEEETKVPVVDLG